MMANVDFSGLHWRSGWPIRVLLILVVLLIVQLLLRRCCFRYEWVSSVVPKWWSLAHFRAILLDVVVLSSWQWNQVFSLLFFLRPRKYWRQHAFVWSSSSISINTVSLLLHLLARQRRITTNYNIWLVARYVWFAHFMLITPWFSGDSYRLNKKI